MEKSFLPIVVLKKLVMFLPMFMLLSQTSKPDIYFIESWKKGPTKIQEQTLVFEINPNTPGFQFKKDRFEYYLSTLERDIQDSAGRKRYQLHLWVSMVKDGDKLYVTESGIDLKDLKHKTSFLLKPSNDPYQDYFDIRDYVWLMHPRGTGDPYLPFLTKRVIKIESFYCIFYVKECQFVGEKKDLLSSLTITVALTNSWNQPK